jgi:hypothetical protein
MSDSQCLKPSLTGFLRLPYEIRDQIYELVFDTWGEPITEPSQLNALTKLFVLNQKIYTETYPLFYGKFYSILPFTFTSVEKLLTMVQSIGWYHQGFIGHLQLHHINSNVFVDPAPPSIYDTRNAIWHIKRHFGMGIWRPNSDDGDGWIEKFKDNPVVIDATEFFSKGYAGYLENVEAELMTGGSEEREEMTSSFGKSVWNSGPKWSVRVKYTYIENGLGSDAYIGEALEISGDLRTSMRPLFSIPALTKRS